MIIYSSTLSGSSNLLGSITITGSLNLSGSFLSTQTINATSSWSTNALTASYVSSSGPTDIWISAGEMIPRSFSGSGVNSLETSTNRVNYDVLEFDAAIDEYAQVTRMLPNNWNGGTVTAKFVWTATTGSGNVVWGLRGRCYADNTAIDSALGTFQTVTDTLQTASYIHITNPTSAITITGSLSVGQPIIFELYRFATTGSDTLAVDAQLLGMQINYN